MFTLIRILFIDRSNRRAGETWQQHYTRSAREQKRKKQVLKKDRGSLKVQSRHPQAHIKLDCGHVLLVFNDPAQPLQEGDPYWCPEHNKRGPAQQQRILSIHGWLLSNRELDELERQPV